MANDYGLLKIHTNLLLGWNQFNKRTAVFGHDNALPTRSSCSRLGKTGLCLTDRKFHAESPAMLPIGLAMISV